jgi:hypothetical protein
LSAMERGNVFVGDEIMSSSLMQTLQGLRRQGIGAFFMCLIALALVAVPRGWAQDNAAISGTATDASGAVVPNASITLTHTGTGVARVATVNSVGAYRFGNIAAGNYILSATAPGFQKFSTTGIVVNVAQTLEQNVTFTVGSESQTVTVQADALQVQTETSEVSTLISGEQVRQLATNGRNVVQLAALGLGVSNNLPSFGGIDALTSANGISFNGQRASHNVYLIDGGEQNDRGCGGCFMNLPSQDAIGEFQTLGSNYSADYGLGSGGTITMMIKSGQRQFHGSLYEFNRNTAYNANDYFLKQANPIKQRPVFQLNTPGGNIGGPLYIPHVYNEAKNRTFFFVNEEWRKLIQGSAPSVSNDLWSNNFPTLGQDYKYTPQGSTIPMVPYLPGNADYTAKEQAALGYVGTAVGVAFPYDAATGTYKIPLSLMDQNMVREINSVFPKPNTTCTGSVCKQFVVSMKQPENIREDVVRIDHAINSKFQLMGRYLHDAMDRSFFPPLWTGSFATVGTQMKNPSYTAAIKLTQTYSSSLLNETAFYYSGNKINLTPVAGAGSGLLFPSGWTANSLFPAANNRMGRMPALALGGNPLGATWNPAYFPWKNGYEGFQYRDDLSWTKGRHQFRFGASWLHTYKNQELQANTNGTANFSHNAFSKDGITNAMMGLADSWNQLEYLYGKNWVNNNYSLYLVDNWHASSRLTLNLGLRYDALPHAFERYNKFSNFMPSSYNRSLPNPIADDGTLVKTQLQTFGGGTEQFYLNGIQEAGVNGFPKGNVENRYFTWQPRVGFTYDLSGAGKTVLRGGAGVFYERTQGNDVYNAALNPPFAYQPAPTNVFFSNPGTPISSGIPSLNLYPSSLTSIRYTYPPQGTMNWSLGIQHQLMPSVIAAVQYVGSSGWDQSNGRQINTLPLTNDSNNYWSTTNATLHSTSFTPSTDPRWNPIYSDRYAVQSSQIVANKLRQYPGFGGINQEENNTNTHYHSLQAGVRFENKWGLTSQVAYTYSHLIDTATADLNGLPNPFNAAYNRGSGGFDRRHIVNISYVYALPFAKHTSNVAARTVFGGWGISGITVFQTGFPLLVAYNGTDTLGLGGGTNNRPNLTGGTAAIKYPKTQAAWFNANKPGTAGPFSNPVAPWFGGSNQGWGSAGKDNVRGPGLNNFNLSLMKTIQFTGHEGPNLELRFESFNTFNKTQFSGVNANTNDGNFGQVTSIYSPRNLELGAKFRF